MKKYTPTQMPLPIPNGKIEGQNEGTKTNPSCRNLLGKWLEFPLARMEATTNALLPNEE